MDDFYKDFEDRFRGSREEIKSRLEGYIPFIQPMLAMYPNGSVFDLGCGRGEWLELTQELGFSSKGVDLNEGMLTICKEKNLNAVWGDAFEHLSKLDDESQVIISAFHVVEHIQFTELRQWVSEAMRVLKPGGLLILETPNTENLSVASQSFYLDPTHLRPIPSALLSFSLENAGFERVKTLRLQESKELTLDSEVKLRDVFFSVSPDYSVIGQKTGSKSITETIDEAFDSSFGLSLESVLGSWESQFERMVANSNQAIIRATESEGNSHQAQITASQALEAAKQGELVSTQAIEAAMQAIREANQATLALQNLHNSNSWKITKPMRWMGKQIRRLIQLMRISSFGTKE